MASYKYTFQSGDSVTPQRLNDARDAFDIVNADIKTDAAIAGTKIAPDFGSQNVATTGNVGAGIANPTKRLHVVGPAADGAGNEAAWIDVNGAQFAVRKQTSAGTVEIGTPNNHNLSLYTNGSAKLHVQSGGNVGIGKTNPSTILDVNGTVTATAVSATTVTAGGMTVSSTAPLYNINNTAQSQNWQLGSSGSSAFVVNDLTNTKIPFAIEANAPSDSLRILSSGNVGIKKVNPATALDVDGTVTATGVAVSNSGAVIALSNTAQSQTWQIGSSGSSALFINDFTNTKIPFAIESNAPSDSLRILSSGNVGINTVAPGSKLHINGDLTVSNATTATTATAGAETLPANPAGFLVVSINGTSRKIPYYAS